MTIHPVQSSQSEEEDSIAFEEELDQLDAEHEEVYSGKLSLKAKQPRTGNIKKHKKQEEYKQMKCDKIQKKRKRKIIIQSSSDQDQEWQPSEQNNSTNNDDEYFGKSANKQKFSKTKQRSDNGEKHRFEAQQSTTKQKLSTKKQRNDNSEKYDFEPQQSTSTQSTFLMDIQNEKPKKNKAKKSPEIRENMLHQRNKRRQKK